MLSLRALYGVALRVTGDSERELTDGDMGERGGERAGDRGRTNGAIGGIGGTEEGLGEGGKGRGEGRREVSKSGEIVCFKSLVCEMAAASTFAMMRLS
jgi:hypothetical protein